MKTYVLMISRYFPAKHPRKGESNFFVEQILKTIFPYDTYFPCICDDCGWVGWSNLLEGGGQIADTGDYGDVYCPKCGSLEITEADNDPVYYRQDTRINFKIHTIRANYDLWKKRIDKVQNGDAELSLRYWEAKPRKSKQVEFCRLGKDDGVGIQRLRFHRIIELPWFETIIKNLEAPLFTKDLAANDGLSLQDFKDWFKPYDLSKPMGIIHFTKFRY